MQLIQAKELTQKQFEQVNTLWNDEYPAQLMNRLPLLLTGGEWYTHFIIEGTAKEIVAWLVVFEKEKECRFSILVKHTEQGKGLGSLLIEQLKLYIDEVYGWVIDHSNDKTRKGRLYVSPVDFYLKNGFELQKDQRMDSELLKAVKMVYRKQGEKWPRMKFKM